jgi:hypothetical protein
MVKQLLLSKWLFMKGEQCCIDGDPYSAGLAISLFQDSTEIFIWAAIKKLDAQVGEKTPFPQYFDEIIKAPANKSKDELPHKAKILELNKARVSFKHYGNLPDASEAQKFRGYSEDFLRISFERFFNEDFDKISLSSLIKFADVKEYVQKAERKYEEKNYQESATELAKARKLLLDKLDRYIPKVDYNLKSASSLFDRQARSHASDTFNYLYNYLDMLRSLNIINMCGVSINDYAKFKTILPSAHQTMDGKFHISYLKNRYSKEDVEFSISFIINLSLKIQSVI